MFASPSRSLSPGNIALVVSSIVVHLDGTQTAPGRHPVRAKVVHESVASASFLLQGVHFTGETSYGVELGDEPIADFFLELRDGGSELGARGVDAPAQPIDRRLRWCRQGAHTDHAVLFDFRAEITKHVPSVFCIGMFTTISCLRKTNGYPYEN